MDFIKLGPSATATQPTELGSGEAIQGYTTATWVERYREAGEFKIEAPLSSGLMDFLPLDTLISHLNTWEIMMVENHHVKQEKGKDPTIEISGRSLEAFLEHRTIGDWYVYTSNTVPANFVKAADDSWDQATDIIKDHLTSTTTPGGDPNDDIAGVATVITIPAGPVATSEERDLEYKDVYSWVIDILKIDDIGIRTQRPGVGGDATTYITIYRGIDRRHSIRFSWMRGDLENIEYFISNRMKKNRARVMSRYAQTVVSVGTTPQYYNRRTMLVDARDLDEQLSAAPVGGALTALVAKLNVRGRQALAKNKQLFITQADVSENTPYRYREDYNLGDLVTVDADFGISQVMRVTEYAEIDDVTKTSGHPTLEVPGEAYV